MAEERRKPAKKGRKPGTKNGPKAPAPPAPEPAKALPGRPEPPPELAEVGTAAWQSLCDDLAEQRTLDRTDRKLMEAYCRLYATFRRIEKQLAAEDLTLVSKQNGRTFINPLVACQADYGNKLRQILNALGLTPKSRKAPKGQGDEADPLDTFLKGA